MNLRRVWCDRGLQASVDDRGIELAEAAVYELKHLGPSGLSFAEIDRALAALNAVRTLTKEDR